MVSPVDVDKLPHWAGQSFEHIVIFVYMKTWKQKEKPKIEIRKANFSL